MSGSTPIQLNLTNDGSACGTLSSSEQAPLEDTQQGVSLKLEWMCCCWRSIRRSDARSSVQDS